jgi:hypothetical protein
MLAGTQPSVDKGCNQVEQEEVGEVEQLAEGVDGSVVVVVAAAAAVAVAAASDYFVGFRNRNWRTTRFVRQEDGEVGWRSIGDYTHLPLGVERAAAVVVEQLLLPSTQRSPAERVEAGAVRGATAAAEGYR